MSDLSKKYKEIITEIENTIKDPSDLNFVKMKIADLSLLYMDIIDRMSQITDNKMQEIENMQNKIEDKISYVEKSVSEIEKDIYEDFDDENDNETDIESDSGYEFEIVCPYCNYEFTTDINMELKSEVTCPDCNNIIELDWNDEEDSCVHECGGCHGGCEDREVKQEELMNASMVKEDSNKYEMESTLQEARGRRI